MSHEVQSYYLIFRQGKYSAIKLIHYVHNKAAAKNAMMRTFGLNSSEIKSESFGQNPPTWAKVNACTVFDGRNAH